VSVLATCLNWLLLNTTVPFTYFSRLCFIQVKTASVFHPIPDNKLSNSSDVAVGHFRSYISPSLLVLQTGVGPGLLGKSLEVL
jgi:hypothetical protein